MKPDNTLPTLSVFILGIFTLVACEHKKLCYDHSHGVDVQIVFDWKKAPEANPASMRLYLFPADGSSVLPYEFPAAHGGRVTVPAGRYKAICLNSDTDSILYRNINRFTDFEAYTSGGTLMVRPSSAPRAEGKEGERIANSPDRLWCAHKENICIDAGEQGKAIIFCPEEAVCHYKLTIKNVENLKYIADNGMSGTLSSMAGGLLIGTGKPTAETVTIPFKLIRKDARTLTAEFLCFGHCPSDKQMKHAAVIYALLPDGRRCYRTYDVTSQIHAAPDDRNVRIELDGLRLPKPIVNGGGFLPDVEEWENIEMDIPM